MKTRRIKFICHAVKWFDKVNGNTYHSVRVVRVRDGAVIAQGMTYGYGSQYEQTALELMADNKWLPAKYRGAKKYQYSIDNNYPIHWEVCSGLKRDMITNAKRG